MRSDNTVVLKPVIPDNTVILKPVIPDNTAISKPVIPAQAEIRTCPHGNLSDKTVAQTPRPRFPLPWE
ncbi:hypothetical protein L4391_001952 [Neisseria gonorrhoeae]